MLVGRDDDDALHAAKLATAVGIRRLAGFLHGGMTSWREEGAAGGADRAAGDRGPVGARGRRRAADRRRARASPSGSAGHIPGSVHVPYHDIDALPEGIDPARPVAVVCASGQRAAVAASLLARYGAAHVVHVVDGGVGTWERAGHPIER